jgi:hypothetical protein
MLSFVCCLTSVKSWMICSFLHFLCICVLLHTWICIQCSGGATPGAAGAVAPAYQLCTSTGMLNFQGKNMIILGD